MSIISLLKKNPSEALRRMNFTHLDGKKPIQIIHSNSNPPSAYIQSKDQFKQHKLKFNYKYFHQIQKFTYKRIFFILNYIHNKNTINHKIHI